MLGREEIIYSTKFGVETKLVNTGYLFAYALDAYDAVSAKEEVDDTLENYEQEVYDAKGCKRRRTLLG